MAPHSGKVWVKTILATSSGRTVWRKDWCKESWKASGEGADQQQPGSRIWKNGPSWTLLVHHNWRPIGKDGEKSSKSQQQNDFKLDVTIGELASCRIQPSQRAGPLQRPVVLYGTFCMVSFVRRANTLTLIVGRNEKQQNRIATIQNVNLC